MSRRAPPSHLTTITHYLLLTVVMYKGAETRANYDSCRNPEGNESSHGPWDKIPTDFTVRSNCMRVVIDELCKDNFPDVSPDDIGEGKSFNRGIFECKGANCSIECIHQTYCNKPPDMEMPTKSTAQEGVGYLPQTINALPRCNRYLKDVNKSVIVEEEGDKCWGKLQCMCGMCCESNDQLTVMTRMLDQTYKDLQAHLSTHSTRRRFSSRPFRGGKGTRARPRVVAYAIPGRQ